MSGEYQVGYGKPPKEHQFKPGNQAARKRNRKRKNSAMTTEQFIDQLLGKRRKIRRGDRVVSLTVAEIIVERLAEMAISGDARALSRLLDMISKYRPDALAAEAGELEITYHRAEGSTVELPPADLWEDRQ